MSPPRQDLSRFDSRAPTSEQRRYLAHLATQDRGTPIKADVLWLVELLVQRGFERVTYESQWVTLDSGPGRAIYWITEEHARALAAVLGGHTLAHFGLCLSTWQPGAIEAFADALEQPSTVVDELTVSHRTGDEVTVSMAIAWARIVTRLAVRSFHLWAAEFDAGALEALAKGLAENQQLCDLDVCDTTKPEPVDKIPIVELDPILEANRTRRR